MKSLRHLLPVVAVAGLAACASTSDDSKIAYKSAEAPKRTLEVPPDLTAPELTNSYAMPAGGVSAKLMAQQQADQAGQQAAIRAGTAQVATAASDTVRLERAGGQRWLSVSGKSAEQLWPLVREFWQDNGFVLKRDEPQLGIMETDWAENRAKIPQDGVRKLLATVGLDGLYATPERDKFRTRFERSPNGNVEIYISHRGMVESFTEGKNDTKWQPRADDPELEAEFLGRLMLALGVDETKAKQAKEDAAQPVPVAQRRARIENGAVVVDDAFDRAWRRTGLALDRSGLVVVDRNRASGTYFVRPAKSETEKVDEGGFWSSLAFWRDKEGKTAAEQPGYRIVVQQVSDKESRVTVQGDRGEALDGKLVNAILPKLEQQLR
ncbi:outer membrane protein assembly factor BamC [Laribacter hongkongensis]|uniref:Outer membrane protein assembly factor BamC n=1 Tax=Laribacter hongkongensis TaxID=168471 RepID=A0ABD4SN78_9NEIS|nr:outer membrane protein assembly factor BamC [Laribacter hongkongensis]MCG9024573.1 outer membrane protein assembly factor BamC [Laribacter hongkongensis]MCG9099607.1 outer membrane protein assembly factor BamC [Laribacter hongkongensis]MCG9103939.1 outer membrane protein assembly factor BamC [Laribacter hongkongensis]MCG9111610.1 outer membrane protein assembly factor BamC [Laribacter hongkongensis]MCG9117140.1 outer membrane protein assembly factor BamC [Laribacter hongkongensis]